MTLIIEGFEATAWKRSASASGPESPVVTSAVAVPDIVESSAWRESWMEFVTFPSLSSMAS